MTAEIIQDVRSSWEYMIDDGPQKMLKFYDRLFDKAPHARSLFPKDLTRQSEKLAYTVGFVVANIDRIDSIRESIEDLGRVHNKLKIKPEYYPLVAETLIEVIQDQMGNRYQPKIGESWKKALTAIAEIMINAPAKRKNRIRKLIGVLLGR